MDLPQQRQRVTVDGLGNIGNIKEQKSVNIANTKPVEKSAESGTMKEDKIKMVVAGVQKIGEINKEIFKCVTQDICTDEVIITDERIKHIKEKHPNDFERYCGYMKEIVENPEYIIEANKPNTALILKSFSNDKEQFKTIMRIITASDNKNYKNSIITFMKINDKEWNRLLRNKKILYKSE